MSALHIISPLLENEEMQNLIGGRKVLMKLDNHQPSGSFKIRGLGALCQQAKKDGFTGVVCPSGGNAGMATAYSARKLNLRAIIVVFEAVSDYIMKLIRAEKAEVIRYGRTLNETYEKAVQIGENPKFMLIPPSDHPIIWSGASTLIDEIREQMNGQQPSLIVTCCGGGGLFCGIMTGLERHRWFNTGVLVMETLGANSFNAMIKNGFVPIEVVCNSVAKTLSAPKVCQRAAEYCQDKRFSIFSHLVTDQQATEAVLMFANNQRILVEISCGTVLSAFHTGVVKKILEENSALHPGPVVMIICGGNDVSIDSLIKWKSKLKSSPS